MNIFIKGKPYLVCGVEGFPSYDSVSPSSAHQGYNGGVEMGKEWELGGGLWIGLLEFGMERIPGVCS